MIDTQTSEIRVLTSLGPIHIRPCGADEVELPPGDRFDAENGPLIIGADVHDLHLWSAREPGVGRRELLLIAEHIVSERPEWWQLNRLGLEDRRALLNAVFGRETP